MTWHHAILLCKCGLGKLASLTSYLHDLLSRQPEMAMLFFDNRILHVVLIRAKSKVCGVNAALIISIRAIVKTVKAIGNFAFMQLPRHAMCIQRLAIMSHCSITRCVNRAIPYPTAFRFVNTCKEFIAQWCAIATHRAKAARPYHRLAFPNIIGLFASLAVFKHSSWCHGRFLEGERTNYAINGSA